jgi:hypothetical protein
VVVSLSRELHKGPHFHDIPLIHEQLGEYLTFQSSFDEHSDTFLFVFTLEHL